MFDNIGGKIKVLAKICCWIGIIMSAIEAIIWFCYGDAFNLNWLFVTVVGLIIIIIGSLFAWISSFFIYGFGELVENTSTIKELSENTARDVQGLKNFVTWNHTNTAVNKKTACSDEAQATDNNAGNKNKRPSMTPTTVPEYICSHCGMTVKNNPCPYCGNVMRKQ